MKKAIQTLSLALFLLATTVSSAQTTIVYEDPSGNNGKVEWTRTMETSNAEIGVPKIFMIPVKNISKEALKITSVKTHCGCTDAKAPEKDIAPGETGFIEVTFTAKPRFKPGANGEDISVPPPFTFYQIMDVLTNFDSKNSVLLSVQGTVIK
jgi:hypothetical protein